MQAVADVFLEGYKASPPHLANLLNPEHELAGISNIQGNFAGFAGAWMNTQDMGWNARNDFVLGFVYNDNDGDGTYDIGDGAASVVVRLNYHGGGTRFTAVTDVNGYFAFEAGQGNWDLRIGSSIIPVSTGSGNVMIDIVTNSVPANMNNTWQHFGRPSGVPYNSWYHVT
jgi:hypothetical protein